jgi:hypothetical protein
LAKQILLTFIFPLSISEAFDSLMVDPTSDQETTMTEYQTIISEANAAETPTARQIRIKGLAAREDKTAEEQELLCALLASEHARQAAQKASAALRPKVAKQANAARKVRTRSLCNLGGLVILAGADALDHATLLGALIDAKTASAEEKANWQDVGKLAFESQPQKRGARK